MNQLLQAAEHAVPVPIADPRLELKASPGFARRLVLCWHRKSLQLSICLYAPRGGVRHLVWASGDWDQCRAEESPFSVSRSVWAAGTCFDLSHAEFEKVCAFFNSLEIQVIRRKPPAGA